MNRDQAIIAVIDDEESIRKALERLLRSAGLATQTFRSGADFSAHSKTRSRLVLC
jgi:FixJ family two-component response regulator